MTGMMGDVVLRTGKQCNDTVEFFDAEIQDYYCDLPLGHQGDHSETITAPDGTELVISWSRPDVVKGERA